MVGKRIFVAVLGVAVGSVSTATGGTSDGNGNSDMAEARDCNLGTLYRPSKDDNTSYYVVFVSRETRTVTNQESDDVSALVLLQVTVARRKGSKAEMQNRRD